MSNAHRPTVLVVEDDPDLRRLISFWLGDDADLLEAGGLGEAQAQLAECRPDAVILDLQLADGRGEALIDSIPAGIPIIAVTGSRPIPAAGRRILAHFPKPFDPEVLRIAVRATLRKPPGAGPG